ncbi:LAGLIDADG family homing endonuclease [Neobacillus sp. PS3-40]|uniref:LAGLIDADG family homing endonuclease n=1 Tax=Neobacillus sp. PS3-40 TaxID=3070679 RepID=UPI0027E18EAD|nr:LAGLIDADG family homing endonuclease [Neobacillus sp. PS3-40]WML45974.1 LAGLIDADG family homing endonuclease [Neobacillus sp. PS3-40]
MKTWEASYVAGIIDGEGSITLTRMHKKEFRRPGISIASTDKELLIYIQSLIGGLINNKKNYNPDKHKNSFTLTVKKKEEVFNTLKQITPFLRIKQKRKRAEWILYQYDLVTPRNGKYNSELLREKVAFENEFFQK